MLDLALSVLFSSSLFVIFKLFSKYNVQTMFAIVTNYIVACLFSTLFYEDNIAITDIPKKPWFIYTLALGILFIMVFNIMAKTSQKIGVSVASVAAKMSLVIPVLVGVLVYKEVLGPLKILGIIMALAAVYFASIRSRTITIKMENLVLPLLVFMGSGLVDTSIKYLQVTFMEKGDFPLFCTTVFGAAGITGLIFILIKSYQEPLKLNLKNMLGGLVLGIFNYFSIYFILRALQNDFINSSSIFTINNVAIVLLSTIFGILFFKENLSKKNWFGIGLAVISIILVATT
ncbi:DMT family transporter [Sediminicola sp. 1XM1-17]|uniref:DMT family transporter n=1 Tax=Sediminicola sp. 1XM1-17 TaxID=3127702 RepID=UPI003077CA7C